MVHTTRGHRIFMVINNILIGILAISCVAPLLHMLAVSFSSSNAAAMKIVYFWPVDFSTAAYMKTLSNPNFLNSVMISFQRVLLGTAFSLTLTILVAYPLSRWENEFFGRNVYVWFFVFTMMFSGGLIPEYIIVQKVGLMNSIWALILPKAANVFSAILLLNFFRTVPKALEEAAYMDGAGHLRTLFSVYIPMSMPAIATISIFAIVNHWNSWFDALIYMSKQNQYPLATLLQIILTSLNDADIRSMDASDLKLLSDRTVKAAQIVIATVPVLVMYPFLQKYFIHGIKLGSVKE